MTKTSKSNEKNISITGDGNVVGDYNDVSFHKIESTYTEFSQAFTKIYQSVEQISDSVLKNDAKELVQKIEAEAKKGNDANPSHVERWIKFLAEIAPDVKDVLIDTLSNPIKGISTVITKIIAKSKL